MTTRLHPPMGERVPAEQVINPQLVAAIARAPVDVADHYLRNWFSTAGDLCGRGAVLVFERFVIGEPCPLLLEAGHEARMAHRGNAISSIDPDVWDDGLEDQPQPLIVDQVIAALAHGQEADRIVSGRVVATRAARCVSRDSETMIEHLDVLFALECVIVSVADTIKVGNAAVIDARLAFERRRRWAA